MKRESNIELLRLLCMFLIIVNHMLGHGVLLDPTIAAGPMELLCYDIGSSIWMPAALVFILISGYFGIHPTMKGIARFVFVCTFYLVISGLMGGIKSVSLFFKTCCILSSATGLWFISAYFYLYCLSPMLNAYMNTLSVRDFRKYILVFLLFEIGIGWVMESPTYNHIILMMLIYSIGYYLGHSNDEWIQRITVKKCILVWLLPTAVLFSSQYFHLGRPFSNLSYTNPFILLQAVMILLIFTKWKMPYRSGINYLAKSALMVYLVTSNVHTRDYFAEMVQFCYTSLNGILLLLVLILLFVCLFFGLLLLDKLVAKIYNPLFNVLIQWKK